MNKIEVLRKTIVEKDEILLKILEERFEIVKEIWKLKKQDNIPFRDKEKEKIKIEYLASKFNLDKEFVTILFEAIFNENERRFNP